MTPTDGFGLPRGTVFFGDGATPLGSAPLVNGSATLTSAALAAGSRSLTASYGGTDSFHTSASAALEAVFTATLASGASPGQVTATVFAGTEYRQHLVAGYYQAYLGRAADRLGLNYFVGILGQGGRDEDVLAGILGSDEYFGRL